MANFQPPRYIVWSTDQFEDGSGWKLSSASEGDAAWNPFFKFDEQDNLKLP